MYTAFFTFFRQHVYITTATGIFLGILGGYFFFGRSASPYHFVTVTRGSIAQTVSVTGNTTPSHSVSLGFASSGRVAAVYSAAGQQVAEGKLLASLATADISAELGQAQANLAAEQARLAGLEAGARPEDIASSQASLDKGAQDLANLYASTADVSLDAYTKADDAIHTELNSIFSGADTPGPSLSYTTTASQAQASAQSERIQAGGDQSDWQSELARLSPSSSTGDFDAAIVADRSRLARVRQLLADVETTLQNTPSLSAATAASYKTAVIAGETEVNTALKNLSTLSQNISSQKLVVAELSAALNLKKAGASSSDIAAEEAAVAAQAANVANIASRFRNAEIVAPQNGIVTEFDAKVGEIVSPGAPLISIISDNTFEVDALVSEVDIGKLAIANTASMTLDAFPGETFTGKVFYIDPAQTVIQGVVGYKVKIAFDKNDPRFKSGLTANVGIETAHKDRVLILPQYAILTNDQGNFVEILQGKTLVQIPVTLGLTDQKGNAEILSGVSEREQVIDIGRK